MMSTLHARLDVLEGKLSSRAQADRVHSSQISELRGHMETLVARGMADMAARLEAQLEALRPDRSLGGSKVRAAAWRSVRRGYSLAECMGVHGRHSAGRRRTSGIACSMGRRSPPRSSVRIVSKDRSWLSPPLLSPAPSSSIVFSRRPAFEGSAA